MCIASDARALELAHGARDVERAAEARVGVDEQRQVGRGRDPPRVLDHVVQCRDPRSGNPNDAFATPAPER
jgi:hypothetical protein